MFNQWMWKGTWEKEARLRLFFLIGHESVNLVDSMLCAHKVNLAAFLHT